MTPERAEEWVDRIDELLRGEDDLTPEELEELREHFERLATRTRVRHTP